MNPDNLETYEHFGIDDGVDYGSDRITKHMSSNGTHFHSSNLSSVDHTCPNRDIEIIKVFTEWRENDVMNSADRDECAVRVCRKCGWWDLHRSRHTYFGWVEDILSQSFSGVSHVFHDPGGKIIHEISDLIDREHKDVSLVSPKILERSLAAIYKLYHGASEVIHLGGPNDQGVDLFCVIEDHTHLIQVKRRTNGKAESVSTVRDLIGAYALRHSEISTSSHSAHIITSAEKFSTAARKATNKINLSKFEFQIELHSYDALQEMFDLSTGRGERTWRRISEQLVPWA